MAKTLLKGHTSQETAYVVDDYPYGFKLRCKIRYWLETTKRGTRFCSQTTNPKKGDKWNAPKASTYLTVGVMFLDEDNHIQWTGVGPGTSEERLESFITEYDSVLTDADRKELKEMRVMARAASKITYVVVPSEMNPQTKEERLNVERHAIGIAAHELKREGKL